MWQINYAVVSCDTEQLLLWKCWLCPEWSQGKLGGMFLFFLMCMHVCLYVVHACERMWVWRPKINTGSLPPLFSALFTQARSQSSPQFDGQLASESPPASAPCLGLQPGLHANSKFARVLGIQTNDTHTCVWPALLHWHVSGSWGANGGVFSRFP